MTQSVLLTVRPLPATPVVVQQPVSQDAIAGQTARFTAMATSQITVQWQMQVKGGKFMNIPNALSNTLTVSVVAADNGNQYRAVFNGKVMSSAATLTVAKPPVIRTQPMDQMAPAGKPVSFSAASAFPTATVQWQVSVDGGETYSNIAGATGLRLTLTAQAAANGNLYRAVFTYPVGMATTRAAVLLV